MKTSVIKSALSVLDVQHEYIKTRGKAQSAYYDGMRAMLDILITDYFTNGAGGVQRNETGHIIRLDDGSIIQSNKFIGG